MNNSELCMIAKRHEERGEIAEAYRCYLEAVIAEDDGEAMNALARMYFEGDYVHESYDKAGRYFGMAYDRKADIEPWTLIIAGSYWECRSVEDEQNLTHAMKYYRAAADLGVAYGHECLGKIHYNLGEYEDAYRQLIQGEDHNPCGLYYLGRLYDEGLGVEQDRNKAIELYQRAVESGSKYEEEYGVDDDCVRAEARLKEIMSMD